MASLHQPNAGWLSSTAGKCTPLMIDDIYSRSLSLVFQTHMSTAQPFHIRRMGHSETHVPSHRFEVPTCVFIMHSKALTNRVASQDICREIRGGVEQEKTAYGCFKYTFSRNIYLMMQRWALPAITVTYLKAIFHSEILWSLSSIGLAR